MYRQTAIRLVSVAIISMMATRSVAEGVVRYRASILPQPPRGGDIADLNDDGVVLGLTRDEHYQNQAYLWRSTTNEIILITPGPNAATVINSHGHVAGAVFLYPYRGALWIPEEGWFEVPPLPGAYPWTLVYSLNDRDQVVGFSATTTGYLHAIVWDREAGTIDLGTFPGGYNSAAWDINNAGQVVGWSTAAIGTRAFLWDAVNGMRTIPPMEVGEGDPYSWIDTDVYFMTDAFLINNLGQVAGYCSDGNVCIWDPIDGFTSIPPPRSNYRKTIPRGFNDHGQLLLTYYPRGAGGRFPYLWDRENGLRLVEDLVAAGTPERSRRINQTVGINNRGQIAAGTRYGEPVLLNPFVLGDLNCDGALNSFDIDPFVQYLADPEGHAAEYPDCPGRWPADTNQDGVVNNFDIDAFVELLAR